MSTELSLYTNEENFKAIAALTGASVSNAVYLPRLRVNRNAINDDGKNIPMGTYSVTQDDVTVYGKTATFRPYINAYQYSRYDPRQSKVDNRSVIIKNFYEEAIDMLGGLACGKVSAKNIDQLSSDQQAEQRNIKCHRLVYGTVTLHNTVDADGNSVEIVDLPVVFRLGGGSFMVFDDPLKAVTTMKHHFFQHNFELSLSKPQKKGDTIYYNVILNPVLDKVVAFTEDNVETLKMFQDSIESQNKFIANKWAEAKKAVVKDYDVASALSLDDPIDDLLN